MIQNYSVGVVFTEYKLIAERGKSIISYMCNMGCVVSSLVADLQMCDSDSSKAKAGTVYQTKDDEL